MRLTWLLILLALTSGCASWRTPPAERLIGTWQYELGGFPVEVTYDDGMATLKGHDPVPYELTDDTLQVAGATWQVSFPSRNEMHQQDVVTGDTLSLMRVTP